MRREPEFPIRQRVILCLALFSLLWLVELLRVMTGADLHMWGILPRTQSGLKGILCAPFIHVSTKHLLLNSGPLLVLSWLALTHGPWTFLRVSLVIQVGGGMAVWALARGSYHVGASGLVMGYLGYLVTRALLHQSWVSFFVAALAVLTYGSLLTGVLPSNSHVSWEMHLAGLLAGALAAWGGPPPGAIRQGDTSARASSAD